MFLSDGRDSRTSGSGNLGWGWGMRMVTPLLPGTLVAGARDRDRIGPDKPVAVCS
jgi:hypothetical protein